MHIKDQMYSCASYYSHTIHIYIVSLMPLTNRKRECEGVKEDRGKAREGEEENRGGEKRGRRRD